MAVDGEKDASRMGSSVEKGSSFSGLPRVKGNKEYASSMLDK